MLSNQVFFIKMGSKYAPNRLELLLYQPKGFSLWGTESPRTRTTTMFYSSAKLNNFQTSNIQCRLFHECGQWNMVSNHACCHLFQMFVSNIYKNEWFQVRFFKTFLGGAHRAPSHTYPLFGLRPRQLSGDSPLRFGLRLQLSIEARTWFDPKINSQIRSTAPPLWNSWLRPCCKLRQNFGAFLTRMEASGAIILSGVCSGNRYHALWRWISGFSRSSHSLQ